MEDYLRFDLQRTKAMNEQLQKILDKGFLDLTEADKVEVLVLKNRLWVNVEGICVLRIGSFNSIEINHEEHAIEVKQVALHSLQVDKDDDMAKADEEIAKFIKDNNEEHDRQIQDIKDDLEL